MNQQQRKQKAQMDSAQARRLKFITKANEVVDRVQAQLELTIEGDHPPYTVQEVCSFIKSAIYEELIQL